MWDFQENGLQLKSSSSDRVDLDYSSFQLHRFIFSFYCHHLKESLFIEMSEYHRLFLNFRCNRETPVCHRREGCIRYLNVECWMFTPQMFLFHTETFSPHKYAFDRKEACEGQSYRKYFQKQTPDSRGSKKYTNA